MLRKYSLIIGLIIFISCADKKREKKDSFIWKSIKVTATAYNSFANQTSSNPHITAWGDSLKPGMPYIAVSRDLIKLGLTHNTPVKLEGFNGAYLVKDKMNRRWKNRIDIYMGEDLKKAKNWGRKKIMIEYGILDTIMAP